MSGSFTKPELIPFDVVESNLVPEAYIKVSNSSAPIAAAQDRNTFQFQDEASQLIPYLLEPFQAKRVWDACAAPGGKTAILCKICGMSGQVVASDLRPERVARLARFSKSTDSLNPDILVADAAKPSPFRSYFDAVLADVPCSGLGTLRRNPEIKWRFQPGELAALQIAQKNILHFVSEAVGVGGRLLYSTCSTEPEENEQVINFFLNTHPGFCLERPTHPTGIAAWTNEDSMVRTYPSKHLWDGFFAALMTRRS